MTNPFSRRTRSPTCSPPRTLFKVSGKVYTITEACAAFNATPDEFRDAHRKSTYKSSSPATDEGIRHALQTLRLRDTGGGQGK